MIPIIIIAATLGLVSAQRPAPNAADAIQAFTTATTDYAETHRRIEALLGPVVVSSDPTEINRAIQTMAAALRAARPDAREGDLFTPAVARELRRQIADTLRTHDHTLADLWALKRVDGVDHDALSLHVNDAFPWSVGARMLPCLIDALPSLPPELQYRIVGEDLVLIDVHASLIVDILRDALLTLAWTQ